MAMQNSTRGKFIVLEGSEGAGKSSQLKKLKEFYGDEIVVTREPGGSPYAEEIRQVILNSQHAGQADAKTHFALFWAARADHLKNTIIPALESGKTVISDRFDSSTYAYQIFGQEAKQLKQEFFTFREFFLSEAKPDLYIYMDVDTEVGLTRKSSQPEELNHFEARKIEFFNRMRDGYTEFFSKVPSVTISANGTFDEVTVLLKKEVDNVLQK